MARNKINIDFNKVFKPVLIGYAAVILVGVILTCIFGVKLDINFSGGARSSFTYKGEVDIAALETALETETGLDVTLSVNEAIGTSEKQLIITVVGNQAITTETQEKIENKLAEYKDNSFEFLDSNSVSPSIAGSFFVKSLVAVLIAGVFVVIYVGVRFRNIGGVSAAITAFVALVLDCIIAFLACTSFRLPVDSNLIAVILTLLGYSLNDTIVTYDRIRENKKFNPKADLSELVNLSINSVIIRNIITTVTTLLAIFTIIIVSEICGLTTLRSFAIPMAFGIFSGCISSLFVSAPLWVIWKNSRAKKK